MGLGSRIDAIIDYLSVFIEAIAAQISLLPCGKIGMWDARNRLFWQVVAPSLEK